LNEVTGFAVGAGLIKPREDHDDGLAIDGARAIVDDQAVSVWHGLVSFDDGVVVSDAESDQRADGKPESGSEKDVTNAGHVAAPKMRAP
jgi:hypothetical protein